MKFKGISLALLFFTSTLFAQKGDTPMNTYDMGGKINFMQLTESGVLVVAGGGGFAGIKPGESQPHFIFKDYGKVKREEVEFIPMSPYVIINQGGLLGTKKTVIDVISGKKLFATEDNGWKDANEAAIFLPENKLVVIGNRKASEKYVLAAGIYNLDNGNQDALVKLDKDVGKTRSAAKVPVSTGTPFKVRNKVLVPTSQFVICADIATGDILWTAPEKNLTWMTADESGKEIYGFEERPNGDTRIHKFSETGKELWSKERKIKGKVSRFQILPQGIAVVSDVEAKSSSSMLGKIAASKGESKIAFLSAGDGTDLWEKAPKTKDFISHFYITDEGILFGLEGGGINKISYNGDPLFKKPLSTGEDIITMATTPQGLIYITKSDANIVNLKTGDPVWKKPVKYKKASSVAVAYDRGHNRYLLSNGTEVLAIDENTGDINTLCKIDFKWKEEPSNLEVRKDGIFFNSDQNFTMVDFDGKEKFSGSYQAPGKSAAGAILAGVGGIAAAGIAMTTAVGAQRHRQVNFAGTNMATIGDLNETGKAYMNFAEDMGKVAGQSFKEMSKRFKATAASENSLFILTKLDDGVGLVKINKDDGKVVKEIVLKDKKPDYEVDDFGGYLFYKPNDRTISVFNLNN